MATNKKVIKTNHKPTNKKRFTAGKVAAIGAGVVAVGAGAYYFLGPKGKVHQKKAKKWMVEMKNEMDKKLTKVKGVSEGVYRELVDGAAKTYSAKYKEHEKEINAFAKKLRGEWRGAKTKAKSTVKKVKKIAE